jgi:NADH:ubiquinone oxidoreductase subunit H
VPKHGAIAVFVIIATWAERRFIARLLDRPGPNLGGTFRSLPQSVADALKLLAKEIIQPRRSTARCTSWRR